jgi:hypothetical protein
MKICRWAKHEYEETFKRCPICIKERRIETDLKHKDKRDKNKKHWRDNNKKRIKEITLKYRYNITIEHYNLLLKEQNNVCAVCKRPETKIYKKTNKVMDLQVDHNHKTGKVRGLLCSDCNISYGRIKESEEAILNLLEYHIKHNV